MYNCPSATRARTVVRTSKPNGTGPNGTGPNGTGPNGTGREAERYDVVIVGAGAAGLMCAVEAGKRGRRVLILEHADRVGKKILISGGGAL